MVDDPRTAEYIDRRRKEGLTKKEAVRCVKRYVAREVYGLLPYEKLGLDSP
jgi:transposase